MVPGLEHIRKKTMLLNARRLIRATDQTPMILLAIEDITERSRLEDELRQIAAAMSEADRRKNEFLALLAHELRNPLAPIRSAVQLTQLTNDPEASFRLYQQRVFDAFDALARRYPMLTIDGGRSVKQVQREMRDAVQLLMRQCTAGTTPERS